MASRATEIIVADHAAGLRLDRYIADTVPGISRSKATQIIRTVGVTVNGISRDSDYRVVPSDRVRLVVNDLKQSLTPDQRSLDIILDTSDFLVVNKPHGLVMHPGAANEPLTLAHRLVAHYPELTQVGHPKRPGIVHRLDRDTSGVVVVARTPESYHTLQRAFSTRTIGKHYLAIVHGCPAVDPGRIEAPIGRHPRHRTHMAITHNGREARTDYRVLATNNAASLVDIHPLTGRTHQIRVHMASIGHAVLGDHSYGPRPPLSERSLLHAWSLEFADPSGKQWLAAAAPPDDFQTAAEHLELKIPPTPETTRALDSS